MHPIGKSFFEGIVAGKPILGNVARRATRDQYDFWSFMHRGISCELHPIYLAVFIDVFALAFRLMCRKKICVWPVGSTASSTSVLVSGGCLIVLDIDCAGYNVPQAVGGD